MNHSGFHFQGQCHGVGEVVGQQGGGQAVLVVVAESYRILRVLCLDDGGDRPEALLVEDPHIRCHVL